MMIARTPRIFREGFWIGCGQVAVAVASLVGVRILTSLMDPGSYGELTLLLGLSILCFGLFISPFLQATLRFFPVSTAAGTTPGLRLIAGRYSRRGTMIGILLIFTVGVMWTLTRSPRPGLLAFLLAGVVLAADVIRSFESSLLNAARRQGDYALRTSLDAWSRPLLATVAILSFGPSVGNVLLGYAAGSLCISAVLAGRTVRGGLEIAPLREVTGTAFLSKDLLAYALPLVPIALLNWIMSLSDRYLLAGFSGAESVGIYAAAYGLGSQPFLAANSFIHTLLRPVLYDAVARRDRQKERRTLRALLLAVLFVSGGGLILVTLFSRQISTLLLGPRFRDAYTLLPWIAAAYALQNLQQCCEIVLYAHACTRRIVFIQIVAAALSLLLYLLFIPRYGAMGAALGTLCTFGATTIVAAVLTFPLICNSPPTGPAVE